MAPAHVYIMQQPQTLCDHGKPMQLQSNPSALGLTPLASCNAWASLQQSLLPELMASLLRTVDVCLASLSLLLLLLPLLPLVFWW